MAPKNDDAKRENSLAVGAVSPPPVQRGRKGQEIPDDVLANFESTMRQGWAGDGKTYENRPAATKAVNDYKSALVRNGHAQDKSEITSRIWQDENDNWVLALSYKATQTAAGNNDPDDSADE